MKITKLEHIRSENTILLCLFTARSTVNIRIFPVNFYFEFSILKSVTEDFGITLRRKIDGVIENNVT